MAIESIATGMDAADIQTIYYALQKQFNAAWAVTQLIAISVPLLLYFSGWGERAYTLLRRYLPVWWAAAFILFIAIALIVLTAQSAIIHHVLAIKAGIEGTAMPSLPSFLAARLPGAIMTAGLLSLVGVLLCHILQRRNRLTWLWLSVLATSLASIALMAAPALTATQPLGNTPVERDIAALAERAGIPFARIATEHCAGQSFCPPGRVIGMGPTRLMLLDDRLTEQTPEDQLLQVFAHEAKHYLIDNQLKPVVLILIICLVLFLVTQTLSFAIISRRQQRSESAADQASRVPLVFGLGLAVFLLLQPAITTYRVHLELEADRFGLEFNRDNLALIDIMRTDAAENPMLVRYTPVTRYFRATHPEIEARIELAERYRPWLDGEAMVYWSYFEEQAGK